MLESIRRQLAAVVLGVVVIAVTTGGVRAADTWTWLDAAAAAPIDHAVTVRGSFDDGHRKMRLTGPVAVMTSDEVGGPCFTVYAAISAEDERPQTADVGGGEPLRLGPPAFLLLPARRVRDGAQATEPPRGVYEVRPLLDPRAVLDDGPDTMGPAEYLGLPVDYRHHFEHVPVEAADRGLVAFAAHELPLADCETSLPEQDATIADRENPWRFRRSAEWNKVMDDFSHGQPDPVPATVADDFGIARLTWRGTGRAAVWLRVRTVQGGDQPRVRP